MVVNGFYRGCTGNVLDYLAGAGQYPTSYSVDIENCRGGSIVTQDFKENELKGCRK